MPQFASGMESRLRNAETRSTAAEYSQHAHASPSKAWRLRDAQHSRCGRCGGCSARVRKAPLVIRSYRRAKKVSSASPRLSGLPFGRSMPLVPADWGTTGKAKGAKSFEPRELRSRVVAIESWWLTHLTGNSPIWCGLRLPFFVGWRTSGMTSPGSAAGQAWRCLPASVAGRCLAVA